MTPPARIQLRLLGRLTLAYSDEPSPIRLSTRKAGALIAYLAMSPEQTASREQLATLLWGSCTDQQARQSLRQALALLRKDLRWSHFFNADTAVVRLQPGLWSVDAREFEDLSTSSEPRDLACAADLFGGEFLTGLNIDEEGFDEWVNAQRHRMQSAASRLCATYAARPDLVSDGQQAIAAVEQLMALDPLREDWQRFALTLYARYRGKNEALAQAEIFAATLRRELGVTPEKETNALIASIRANEIALVCNPTESVAPAHVPAKWTPVRRQEHAPEAANIPPVAVAPIALAPPPSEVRENVGRPHGWARLRSVRNVAAALALAGAVALGAIGFSHTYLLPERPGEQTAVPASAAGLPGPAQSRVASADDPWQPPAPANQADGRAAVTQPSGLTAILVLPFTSVGEPSEQSTLSAELMTDDLTNALSRAAGFRVISRQTAMSYRGQQVDPAAVGTELGVHYVLEGRVEAQGSSLRASVELIDTRSRLRMWSGRYDRIGTDRTKILDDMIKSVGRELQLEVTHAEGAVAARDPDVHALIYKGFSAMADAGRMGQPALEQSKTYFTEALAREPDNPRALTGLGMYHVQMAVNLYAPDPAPHLAKAEAILQQVIARHPGVGGPYRLMGVLNIARGRAEIAAQWLQREIEINPSDAPSYAQLGRTMTMRGQAAEGIKYILYAMRLSPRDQAMAFWLGMAAMAELEQGHDHKAIEYLDRQLLLKPGHPRALIVLAAIHALAGNPDAARSRLEQLRKALPHLSGDKLIERYFGGADDGQLPRFREGLRLALASADDPWQPPTAADQAGGRAAVTQPSGLTAILVLPFTSVGEPSEQSTLSADLMTDDLTNALSRISGFRVISRRTAMSYRGQQVNPAAVGTELGVRYVLEGSVEAQGSGLRASVELIDTRSRSRVWSARYDRAGADRLMILDDMVRSVGRELQIEVTRAEGALAAQDPDVHALIYKGYSALNEAGRAGQPALEQAKTYFTEALAREPDNLRAQAGLGAYHVQIAVQLFAPDPATHLAKAEAILQQIIARDPDVGGPYRLMGLVNYARRRADIAAQWFQREIDLNPSDANSYAQLGRTLAMRGRAAEGIKYILYAMRLSPRDPTMAAWLGMAGAAELEQGHDHKAVAYLDRALSLHPSQPRNLLVSAAAHALSGNPGAARLRLEEARKALPHLSSEKVVERYFGGPDAGQSERLREGLRLAIAPAGDPPPPPLKAATAPAPGIR